MSMLFIKRMFSFASCLYILVAGWSGNLSSTALIWDLGNTLFEPDEYYIAHKIGYLNCAYVYFKYGKECKTTVNETVFDILNGFGEEYGSVRSCDPNGRPLPLLMSLWFKGKLTPEQAHHRAMHLLDTYQGFTSRRYKRMLSRVFNWMFNPTLFATSMQPISGMVNLLRQCACNTKNTFYVLSNWDPLSFEILYRRPANWRVFRYFKPPNMFISGLIGDNKPCPSLYHYLLKKAQLNPSDCIVIDDQPENIDAALACGMKGIHFDGNIRALKRKLKEYGVL